MSHMPIEPPESFRFAWTKYSDAEIRNFELCLRSFAVTDYHRERSHYLSPGVVFHVVLSGRGMVESGRRKFECGPGSMFVFWPEDEAEYYELPSAETWSYVWFWLAGSEAQRVAMMAGLSPRQMVYDLSACPEFKRRILEVRQVFESRNFSHLYPVAAAWNLMDALAHELVGCSEPVTLRHRADEVRIMIENLPATETGVNQLAKHFGVTRATINRWFRSSFGASPKEHIDRMRFERATALLEKSDLSVKEIALSCGFNSAGYFSTAFRKRFGFPPKRRGTNEQKNN